MWWGEGVWCGGVWCGSGSTCGVRGGSYPTVGMATVPATNGGGGGGGGGGGWARASPPGEWSVPRVNEQQHHRGGVNERQVSYTHPPPPSRDWGQAGVRAHHTHPRAGERRAFQRLGVGGGGGGTCGEQYKKVGIVLGGGVAAARVVGCGGRCKRQCV